MQSLLPASGRLSLSRSLVNLPPGACFSHPKPPSQTFTYHLSLALFLQSLGPLNHLHLSPPGGPFPRLLYLCSFPAAWRNKEALGCTLLLPNLPFPRSLQQFHCQLRSPVCLLLPLPAPALYHRLFGTALHLPVSLFGLQGCSHTRLPCLLTEALWAPPYLRIHLQDIPYTCGMPSEC